MAVELTVNNRMHSDRKKRRSFVALLFVTSDAWRYIFEHSKLVWQCQETFLLLGVHSVDFDYVPLLGKDEVPMAKVLTVVRLPAVGIRTTDKNP